DRPEAIMRDDMGEYLFIKHLKDDDYFVNVSFDNGEYLVSISNGIKETRNLNNKLKKGGEFIYQSPNFNFISQKLLQTSQYSANKIDEDIIAQNAKEQSLFNDIIQENEGGNHNAKQNQRNEFERVERTMQNDTGGTLFKGEFDKEKSHDKRGASGGSVIHSTRDELTAPQILQESDTKNSKRGSTGASGRGYTAGEENKKSIRVDDSKRSEQISTDENHLRENNTGSYDNERYKQANNVQSSGRLYKKPIRSNGGLDNRNLPQQILNKKWSEALEKRGILSPLQNAQKEAKKEQATQKYTFTESANEKQILEDNYKALEGLLNLEKIRKYKIEREKFEAKYSKAEYFSQADVKAITKYKEIGEELADLHDKALMKLLANFKGFGKATNALLKLKGEEKAKWDNMLKDLSKALGVKINIADLVQRSKDAYYTPDKIIEKMVKLVDDFAKNANKDLYDLYKLEPSAGIGRFFNHLPIANSYAVEKDTLSAKMSEYLYEGLKVDNSGYENSYFKLENQFDLVIGNPPYANFKIGDDTFKENIHNYFMKKNVDNLRADGISLQIITHNFMDAKNPYTRDLIAKDAEFLGAVRLPNTTFKDASVTTDIIAFRKRNAKDKDFDTSWAKSVEIEKDVWVNQYFLDNPQNVLGKMEVVNSQFGRAIAVKNENFDLDSLNLSDFIKSDKAFKSKFDFDPNSAIYNAQYELSKKSEGVSFFQSARGGELRYDETKGRFVVLDDNLKEHDFNVYEKIAEAKPDWKESFIETKLNALKEMMPKIVKVKEALFKLKEAELNPNASDEKIEILRRILNKAYDELQGKNGSFRNAYGKISQKWQMYELLDDTSFELFALEKGAIVKKNSKNKSEVKGSEKSDIFYKRVTKPYVPPTHANTLMDAVNISKAEKGVIDLERLTGLLGKELEEVEKELLESKQIYKDHNGKNIEKDEFLSGNIREKIARFYDENGDLKLSDDAYIKNLQLQSLEDLKNIIPEDIELPHINIPLGANWLEKEILERFFKEELDLGEVKLRYFDKTWLTKGRFEGSIEITTSKEYAADTGIKAINGADYILKMMNNESLIFALSFRSIIYRLCAFSLKFHAFCMSLSSMLVRLFCR
ncbi:TPA: Eco57I restriction-modification methylase domain-containing protein, partial [Campylobacter upsaliensis]|nr:Eco57I restriction-modification methylase domain-containing protein [Campylobacter upsaliensis]